MSVQQPLGLSATTLSFSRGNIGEYQAGWRALIEGMADRTNDVKNSFLQLVKEHNIPEIKHAAVRATEQPIGEMIQSREYYVVEKLYSNGAKSTLAVRIAPFGKDMYVEWLHYELGVLNWPLIAIAGLGGCILTFGFLLILFIPLFIVAVAAGYIRRDLTHFEKQDSWATRAVVDTCLRSAIDHSGISKELIREVPGGQGDLGKRRII